MAMWNAVQKYYCSGDFQERIYDEPNTADTWWNVDVSPYISPNLCMVFTFFFSSLNFRMMIYSVIAIYHSIFGLTRAWLLVA